MKTLFASFIIAIVCIVQGASAQQSGQDVAWVQIEAHPSLRVARDRAGLYSGQLADVNGFSLGGSWYGILLGPYTRADAERVLQVYREQGQIPPDSFLAGTEALGQRFWPDGANAQGATITAPPAAAPADQTAQLTETAPQPEPADETPAEARRSERLLTAQERRDLQVALKAAGFYDAAIDGAYGPGTRRSMSDWQSFNGFEPTGILTTRQRQTLMDQYNAPLISVGMARIDDLKAGISMQAPMGEVRFTRYEPPFAHYDSAGDLGARLLLISQPGTRATLFGLYDILQTLEIVPLNGPRQKGKDSFTIEGRGNGIVSYTEAALKDGEIKGFTLVWPAGDEDRRTRVLAELKASFERRDGVLDPAAGADAEQRIDLVSGLQVRKPRLSRSGFYIDNRGAVLTSAEAVRGCTRITLDHDYVATVVTSDAGLGVALLRPEKQLAPMAVAKLRGDAPRLQSEVAAAGYSYGGVLGAPTLTFGTLADLKGLRGETELARLDLAPLPGDAGGPVLDTGGAVIGMLLPPPSGGQRLPNGVSFAAAATALQNVLDLAGITAAQSAQSQTLPPDDLSQMASKMTVLVSCWD